VSAATRGRKVALEVEIDELRRRLEWAEDIHRAIVDDEVDGFVIGRSDDERRVLLLGEAHLPFQQDAERERDRRHELERVDQLKNEFIAVLGHELRNPLASLVNGLEILRLGADLEPRLRQVLEMMGRQTATLIRLVDDLLDVNRLEQGKVSLHRRRIDLKRAVLDAAESARPALEAKRHVFEIDLCDEPVWVEGDLVRLTQVVLNLLLNAARYTNEGGTIRLGIACESRGAAAPLAIVRVRDTGIGIAPDQLARVFEPFAQVGPTGGHSNVGLGLGLTISRRLVELHGGRVSCHSAGLGAGSEFIVEMPTAQE
jgi:signal transduction histidine kinase